MLNCENRFDLVRSFNKQVLGTLLTLRIDDFLALLFFLCFNRLFELDSVHCCLAETSFVDHFVASDSVFFGRVLIWFMFENLTVFLVTHFLILFKCFFSSLLEILLNIMNHNKIIDSCYRFGLWQFFQLWKRNLRNKLLILNIKWTWPLVSIVNIEVLKLWISSFEILEMIHHNLHKFHFEKFASLRLKIRRNWSGIWFKTWLSSKLINLRGIFRNGNN